MKSSKVGCVDSGHRPLRRSVRSGWWSRPATTRMPHPGSGARPGMAPSPRDRDDGGSGGPGPRTHQALRRHPGGGRHRFRRPPRRGLRSARTQRCRQDHDRRDPRGPALTGWWRGHGPRPRCREGRRQAQAAHRGQPPDGRDVPEAHRDRAHRPVPQLLPDSRVPPPSSSRRWVSASARTPRARSCRAASGSAWRSRSRSSTTRSSSSSTNRRPASTRRPVGRCGISSATSRPPGGPCFSRRTTWRRPRSCAIGSRSWTTARSSRWARWTSW